MDERTSHLLVAVLADRSVRKWWLSTKISTKNELRVDLMNYDDLNSADTNKLVS